MIKLRTAQYCNLKLLLTFLVIYGHLIEPYIYHSRILMLQYKCIYMVHMPLFSFISGLFLNDTSSCQTQLRETFPLYILLQTIAFIIGYGKIKWFTPYWHLWYLLSYCCWLCIAWIWFMLCKGKGKFIVLICSVIIGCIAGFIPFIGREFSLSRTLVFLPYFWTGLILKPEFSWRNLKSTGLVALIISIIIIFLTIDIIPATFLYQATPYKDLEKDIFLRLICYLIAFLLGLFLLTAMPTQRFPFTKVGTNTMLFYLIHIPFVLYLRECNIKWQFHIIITIVFIYLTYILTQWHSKLYGIVPTERRDCM